MNEIANKAAYYARIAQYASDGFSQVYLGAKDVAPTTDNTGNPLIVGALYFNTVSDILYVWDGSVWDVATNFNETTPFLSTGSTTARTLANRFADAVSVKDFGAVGNGIADDRNALILAMSTCAANGKELHFTDGVYACSDWLPIPSGLKARFSADAQLKLTGVTSLGGFVCFGYDINLNVVSATDIEIHDLNLDCNNISGENGFNGVNGTNIRIHSPKIYNCLHDTIKLGGRAFQFEGAIIDGVNIFNPYIENCSIGINSQGDPAASSIVTNINYFNVVMRNVCIPFNIDSQYPNPQNNTPLTMSTTVYGVELFNCGKITWSGGTASGGGIICGDRGAGLSISGLRLINDAAYGGIGAIVHGVMFDVRLENFEIYCTYASAIFDFSAVSFGSPSLGTFASRVEANNIKFIGNLDYIVQGGPSNDRIGRSVFNGIVIEATIATPTGFVDANAGSGTSGTNAYINVILNNQNFDSSGLRSLSNIFSNGNNIGVCLPVYEEGDWTPVDASGAGLTFTISGTPRYVRQGRVVTANCAITYPSTANTSNALIGGLPFTSSNFSSMGGSGIIAYSTETSLNAARVIGNTKTILLSNSSGIAIQNSALSGDQINFTFIYFA